MPENTEAVTVPRKRTKKANKQAESQANAEIDRRLAEAIKERTKLIATVSRLVSAQDRLARIEQEINSLVQLQQRLNGTVTMPAVPLPLPDGSSLIPPFSHTAVIPAEIGSHPTPKQPKPTTANMGPTVAREGGFS